MFQEDFILRPIQQLSAYIAHIAGLDQAGQHDKALAAADQGWGKLLDAPRQLIDVVDTPTFRDRRLAPA